MRTRRIISLALATALAGGGATFAGMQSAVADTAPPAGTPVTVAAQSLPTWQVNGVVYDQVIVGSTVYVTGSFSEARPPGVPLGGAGTVLAMNIFAYDLNTGERVPTFAHSLNKAGYAIAVSPDKTRLYVGGNFTTIDGQPHTRLAAIDLATNSVVADFNPSFDAMVRTIVPTADTVYVGGFFTHSGTTTRNRLAAVRAGDGGLTSWAPNVNSAVWDMVMVSGNKLVSGGQFTTANGRSAWGTAAFDGTTGASSTWLANQVVRNGGSNSGISGLYYDGTNVYGAAWSYSQTGNLEGQFAARGSDGAIQWVNNCLGDSYDVTATSQLVYSVSHSHDCSAVGSFGDIQQSGVSQRYEHAMAMTKTGQRSQTKNAYGFSFSQYKAPTLLHWWPQLETGNITGLYQAAWTAESDENYVILGGEFPKVNGVPQQGLARFGLGALGGRGAVPTYTTVPATSVPATTASVSGSTVTVRFGSAWDPDNQYLTYQLLRDGVPTGTPTTSPSTFWQMPTMSLTDTSVPAGAHTYAVTITDPMGNALTSPSTTVSVGGGGGTTPTTPTDPAPAGSYAAAVQGDGARHFWRLGEASGSIAADSGTAAVPMTKSSGMIFGAAGAVSGDTAASLSGTSAGAARANSAENGLQTLSVEGWVKTTTTSGGPILAFSQTGSVSSTQKDRALYLGNDGRVTFGVYPGTTRAVTSTKRVNDGAWHHVVGTLGGGQLKMYVDGVLQSTASASGAQSMSGYWRTGAQYLGGFPNQPWSWYLRGTVDELAVYPTALSASQVAAHYAAR